jgi:Skp family chaperone for outer membrane proteins
LEEKAAGWKKEIENRSRKIEQKKEGLNSERILLTNEMIDEIEEEITLDEEELSEYQQKRFGPRGDLIIQKQQLIQPIQDQIFNAIRELAESKNYDFIFDKSADIVMLYSDKRFDVSDQILRTISRANNRKKLDSRKDKREIENQSLIDDESTLISDLENKENDNIKEADNDEPKKKMTVKELLEQRKQKNSNKRKVKD